ncbi:uncharacterized protein TNCV_376351 [Trichonephila clavipes]|nr:uncharacterized protein TNCV_376351 [Trichonephila clavipes]
MNLTWRNPPAHHWYAAKSPGLSVQCRSSKAHQTALASLRSGHLRSMTFVQELYEVRTYSVFRIKLNMVDLFLRSPHLRHWVNPNTSKKLEVACTMEKFAHPCSSGTV